MNQKELQAFKKRLTGERSVLMSGITTKMTSSPKTGDAEGGDVCDIASSDRERDLKLRPSERDRGKLREIDEALERIADATFGECERCGAKIPMGRLKVMPFATECVACKSKQERQRRIHHGGAESTFPGSGVGIADLDKEDDG